MSPNSSLIFSVSSSNCPSFVSSNSSAVLMRNLKVSHPGQALTQCNLPHDISAVGQCLPEEGCTLSFLSTPEPVSMS